MDLPYFKILDKLPTPPQWLIDQIDVNERPDYEAFTPDATQWLLDNVASNFNTENSGWVYFNQEQLPCNDLTKEWSLIFNVYPGGDDVELCFWQEPGQPIRRTDGYKTWDTTDGLDLLKRIKGPFDHWYIMHNTCIHSVRNMQGSQLNLQLNFDHGIIPSVL
jgi:hypothetical protein